jgi:hypothetical protein
VTTNLERTPLTGAAPGPRGPGGLHAVWDELSHHAVAQPAAGANDAGQLEDTGAAVNARLLSLLLQAQQQQHIEQQLAQLRGLQQQDNLLASLYGGAAGPGADARLAALLGAQPARAPQLTGHRAALFEVLRSQLQAEVPQQQDVRYQVDFPPARAAAAAARPGVPLSPPTAPATLGFPGPAASRLAWQQGVHNSESPRDSGRCASQRDCAS